LVALALELASRSESAQLPSSHEIEVEYIGPNAAAEPPDSRSCLDPDKLDTGDSGGDDADDPEDVQSRRRRGRGTDWTDRR